MTLVFLLHCLLTTINIIIAVFLLELAHDVYVLHDRSPDAGAAGYILFIGIITGAIGVLWSFWLGIRTWWWSLLAGGLCLITCIGILLFDRWMSS